MARNFGKIFASQWDDEDFLTLGADAKYIYDFLVAQSDLGHSGIITLRIAPWARRLSKTTGEVEAALRELHQRRYVVADDDEMLLLIRSLIRRDDVYKQPNVFKAAVSQIYACPSKPIRAVLLSELDRLDESAMKGDTVQVCADLVAWLRKTCGNPSPNPSGGGSRIPQSGESADTSEYGHAPGKGAGEEGSGNPSGNPLPRAHAHARVPLPLPLPLAPSEIPNPLFLSPTASPPADEQQDAAEAVETETEEAPAAKPKRAKKPEPQRDDVDALCARLAELMIANECKPPAITDEWRREARLLLDRDGRQLQAALNLLEWSQKDSFWKSNIHSMPTFRAKYDQLRQKALAEWERQHADPNVIPIQRANGRPGPYQNPTDHSVYFGAIG